MAEHNDNNDDVKPDPDYFIPKEKSTAQQNVFEENARSSTVKKISTIIENEFFKEIESKKKEVTEIYKTLTRATRTMHFLRYAIVADYYNKDKCMDTSQFSQMQPRPHPTVNAPKRKVTYDDMDDQYTCCKELGIVTERERLAAEREQSVSSWSNVNNKQDKAKSDKSSESTIKEEPGTSNEVVSLPADISSNGKITKRILVGNISKWIDPEFRGKSNACYKWTIYVEDQNKGDLSSIISKVRFFLHPSYKPHDVIDVTSSPFHLARFGWGEFPVRVQLHFVNPINKPTDIIHQLKLDQTFTGLQTFGAQTVVDITINTKNLISLPGVMDQENSSQKDCDNYSESDLALLLKNRIKDKESNVTICHDLPTDHDYLNLNSKPSTESSIDVNSKEETDHTEVNDLKNKNLTKAVPKHVPVLKEKTDLKKIKIENFNSQDKSNNSSITSNVKASKYLSKNEITEAMVHLINHAKPDNLANILKIIASKTPMITEKALNPQYKAQHPYVTESYIVYSSYSKAKKNSMERQRAIRALDILSKSKHKTDLSVKDFVIWARKYGYSPVDNTTWNSKKNAIISVDDEDEKIEASSTVIEETYEWIKDLENKECNLKNDNESNEEIDVLGDEPTLEVKQKKKEMQPEEPKILLNYPETKSNLHEYVQHVTDKLRIKLPPQELCTGILHSTSSLVITKAVECLVDELLRLSHSSALERCKNDTVHIDVDDVRMALLKRDKFEILTNSGLGSEE